MSGNAALPIILGDETATWASCSRSSPCRWSRSCSTGRTRGFEIRTAGANPDAARYAGMRPAFLIILTMTLSGLLGGPRRHRADPRDQPRRDRRRTARPSASTRSRSRCSGARTRSGSCFAALLFGALRAGAGLMQIEAGIPPELVDVLQATILLFLVADPVLRRIFRLNRRAGRRRRSADDHALLRRPGGGALMDQLIQALYGIPLLGLIFQFGGYLIAILPIIAPIILRARHAARPRRAVRRDVRAIRRREHRHRGHDAGRGVRRLARRASRWRRRSARAPAAPSSASRRRS